MGIIRRWLAGDGSGTAEEERQAMERQAMRDKQYQAELAAAHERMQDEANARADEHIRAAMAKKHEREREERARGVEEEEYQRAMAYAERAGQVQDRKERTRQLIQLGGVCAARGFTDVDELGAFFAAAGRPEHRRRRRP